MSGNPQMQTFTYDSLNRLTSAQATGGTIGNYAQQSYTYDANTGNLASKAGVSYGYNDAAHAHAVTHLGGVQKYGYDANGNQTKRIIGADTYDLAYDAENRLVEVKKNSSVYATFVYNADGQRVKSIVNGVSIGYVGSYAEWTSSSLTSYYYAGAAQIAMRQAGELIYVFGDDPSHSFGTSLGSTSKTYKASNGETKMQLYTPWGERRYPTAASEISSRYRYTGQYEYSELGLYFYQSRWYDAALGRFAQADTVVPNPGDSQSWDRYAYVNNNPILYKDSTGHYPVTPPLLFNLVNHFFGFIPDERGIRIANTHMDRATNSIIPAAGIAVQSQWYGPWNTHQFAPNGNNSGLGIAQVSDKQMKKYGLLGQNQEDPAVAIQAMEARIKLVLDACKGCNPRDQLIAAALAQNGPGFDANELVSNVFENFKKDGVIDWVGYFDRRDPKGNINDLRSIGRYQYDTRFMLHLYIRNMLKLYEQGWELPEGITEEDLAYLYTISWGFGDK